MAWKRGYTPMQAQAERQELIVYKVGYPQVHIFVANTQPILELRIANIIDILQNWGALTGAAISKS